MHSRLFCYLLSAACFSAVFAFVASTSHAKQLKSLSRPTFDPATGVAVFFNRKPFMCLKLDSRSITTIPEFLAKLAQTVSPILGSVPVPLRYLSRMDPDQSISVAVTVASDGFLDDVVAVGQMSTTELFGSGSGGASGLVDRLARSVEHTKLDLLSIRRAVSVYISMPGFTLPTVEGC